MTNWDCTNLSVEKVDNGYVVSCSMNRKVSSDYPSYRSVRKVFSTKKELLSFLSDKLDLDKSKSESLIREADEKAGPVLQETLSKKQSSLAQGRFKRAYSARRRGEMGDRTRAGSAVTKTMRTRVGENPTTSRGASFRDLDSARKARKSGKKNAAKFFVRASKNKRTGWESIKFQLVPNFSESYKIK